MSDNDMDTRKHRKILYWFLSPPFQLRLCPVWGWGQQMVPTATHGHVSSDSWRPWVPCGSGKRRVGAKGGIQGWMGPPALLHPLGAASGCKPRRGGWGWGRPE